MFTKEIRNTNVGTFGNIAPVRGDSSTQSVRSETLPRYVVTVEDKVFGDIAPARGDSRRQNVCSETLPWHVVTAGDKVYARRHCPSTW